MPGRELVIFAAMEPEAKAVLAGVRRCGADIALPEQVVTIGIRAGRLPSTETLQAAVAIILAGYAGALDPSLAVGELVLDSASIPLPELGFRRGNVYTTEAIVATPADKAGLFAETGAAAVDMESKPVRDLARRLGIPFIGLRVISDTAQESLDPAVVAMVDEMGRPKPGAIAGHVLRRPAILPMLVRLGRASRLASGRLADGVCRLLPAVRGHFSAPPPP